MRTTVVLIAVLAIGLLAAAVAPVNWNFISPTLDSYMHLLGGFVVALFLCEMMLYREEEFGLKMRKIFFAVIVSVIVWSAVEVFQMFLPKHGPEWSDLKADVVGAALAGVLKIAWELHKILRDKVSTTVETVGTDF